jgi:hypothetical protein
MKKLEFLQFTNVTKCPPKCHKKTFELKLYFYLTFWVIMGSGKNNQILISEISTHLKNEQ